MNVNGITTAALIWITAALGMAIGYHNYPLALVICSMVVVTLFVIEPIQRFINKPHRVKDYKIKTNTVNQDFKNELEVFLKNNKIKFFLVRLGKEDNDEIYMNRISSPNRNYDCINNFLLHHRSVRNFDF